MAILQINTIVPAQVGVFPGIVRIVSDDDLATITTAGYLDYASQIQGYTVYPGDLIFMTYTETEQLKTAILTASVSNGVITLTIYPSPATGAVNYEAPITTGHFATYNGTGGDIEDLGYLPSDSSKTRVVMANAATTIGNAAIFSDINGTIQNGGTLGTAASKVASNNALPNLSSVTTPSTIGNLPSFADVNGSIEDSGISSTGLVHSSTPTIVNHFPVFSNTSGSIEDLGYFPSDPTALTIAGVVGTTPTSNHFVSFVDPAGTIRDNGYVPTDATKTAVVMTTAPTVVGNIAAFSDVNGTIQDSGFPTSNIQPFNNIFGETITFPGGFSNFTVNTSLTNIPVGAVIVASPNSNTNDVPMTKIVRFSATQLELSFASDPGAGSFSFILLNASQT